MPFLGILLWLEGIVKLIDLMELGDEFDFWDLEGGVPKSRFGEVSESLLSIVLCWFILVLE